MADSSSGRTQPLSMTTPFTGSRSALAHGVTSEKPLVRADQVEYPCAFRILLTLAIPSVSTAHVESENRCSRSRSSAEYLGTIS